MRATFKKRGASLSRTSIPACRRCVGPRHGLSGTRSPNSSLAPYSTTSNPNRSPAVVTASVSPANIPIFGPFSKSDAPVTNQLFRTLPPLTVLPTPLPEDANSPIDGLYFPRSQFQETMNIIDACLYNCHDVRRAQALLHGMRQGVRTNPDAPSIDVSVYNKFISAYIRMASDHQPEKREDWIKEAWDLYHHCINDGVAPDATTYAFVLVMLARFSPSILAVEPNTHSLTFEDILSQANAKHVAISDILLHIQSQFESQAEKDIILTRMGQWAVQEGVHSSVLKDLNSFKEAGNVTEDPVAAFPHVRPVVKPDPELLGYRSKKREIDEDTAIGMDLDREDQTSSFNLDTLRSNLDEVLAARRALPQDAATRQRLLEMSAVDAAAARMKHDAERLEAQGLKSATATKKASLRRWMWEWYEALYPRIEAEIKGIMAEPNNAGKSRVQKTHLLPFLTLLKPKKLALLTIMEILRLYGTGGIAEGMKTARALISVGIGVEMEHNAQIKKRHYYRTREHGGSHASSDPLNEHSGSSDEGLEAIRARRDLAREQAKREAAWSEPWSQAIRIRVGSILVDALMDSAMVTRHTTDPRTGMPYSEEQPAFNHSYEYVRGKKLGVIKLNPEVAKHFAETGTHATLHPRHLPMLVPPRPWVSHDNGAYLFNKSSVMRIKGSHEQLLYLAESSKAGHLELVYSGLDVLGSTPWVINQDVFGVVLEVWNSGHGLRSIPPAVPDVPDPVKPPDMDTNNAAKSRYIQEVKDAINARRNNHSERCSVNYKLEIARAFVADKFYLPHNIDFRGRAYPIPPHLNHVGDDLSRGLLKFAERKPLGTAGLRWLKIHLANLYGYDKASFDERETWVMERLDAIYDSALKPLEGHRWWLKADDPWQCLATCMELRAALDSPDPLSFESNLPVHQDGTCNGLQHYAALGGDKVGAQQVNLAVTDRPSDVYSYVANMVEKQIDDDVAKGNELAKMLQGKVSRKVVKQTVMTTVYGVTFVGARAQIEKQLRDRGDVDRMKTWDASNYLAKKTLGSIQDLFSGAKAIQDWLHFAAKLIAKSVPPNRLEDAQKIGVSKNGKYEPRSHREMMTSVIWTTPMGLPIVQPYRKLKRKQIITGVQSVYISDPSVPSEVNPLKQSSAFPPNFIHSLDATHMMLTALECRKEGLTFASVHDSYWTHASSVLKMSQIIRDTFVQLHSSDLMGRLLQEFTTRYEGHAVPIIHLSDREVERINESSDVQIIRRPYSVAGRRRVAAKSRKMLEDEDDHEVNTLEADTELSMDDLQAPVEVQPASESVTAKLEYKLGRFGGLPAHKQFVPLQALLPKLPAKGNFSVETIRKSLYFFS
ncbi:uncharacterized protein EI90DRAFT_2992928 [Cantharellus anzutake]|uniref:uncharacterized protein n=1 Tax=Cantharellus anzutake TaxID=1750568 RepID=UPI001903B284|nr:uncharacterized protein EI90DRAFT_2992928 [Cantharellus anzutake]KAF8335860.1 hypothetical protein EI90DRAFT_2992928 [Cantharellus anzutake]